MNDKNRKYYLARVISNGLRKSANKQTPSIAIQCLTSADVSDVPNPHFKPSTLYGDLYLTEAALPNTLKTLKQVFRWKGYSFADFNEPILTGVNVKLVVEIDEKGKEKICFFNRPGAFKPMEEDELADLVKEADALLSNAPVIEVPDDMPF